jgi:hypothetical protein
MFAGADTKDLLSKIGAQAVQIDMLKLRIVELTERLMEADPDFREEIKQGADALNGSQPNGSTEAAHTDVAATENDR